jgi:hypothetical protein
VAIECNHSAGIFCGHYDVCIALANHQRPRDWDEV